MAAVGTVIAGRYRLVDQLAVGGMGSVWRAWDELLERPVAVKQLLTQPGLSNEESDTARMRIIREARITARLHHPNAVTLFDVVQDDGHPCLIMQYVPSKSLSTLLREQGPVGVRFATKVGAELAAALATAHRVGVVHRDVKPGNVLITKDGTAKLTDFGISHAVGDATLTSTGVLTGTPAFLAPEVARGEESGFPADVFSLGATLYAALEGFPPFGTDPNPMAVLHRVALGKILPPQQSGPLTALLMRMLSTDPGQRPAMTDIAATLNSRLGQESARTDPADRSTFALTVHERPDPLRTNPPEPAVRTLTAPVPILPPADRAPAGAPILAAGPPERWQAGSPPTAVRASEAVQPRRRRSLLVAGALAALIALITVVGYIATRPDGRQVAAGDPATTAAPSSAAASGPASAPASAQAPTTRAAAPAPAASSSAPESTTQAQQPSTTATSSARSSTTQPPSTAAPSEKSTPQGSSSPAGATGGGGNRGGAPTAAQLTAAITDYYAVMPANTDQGWRTLTPSFQSGIAQNREYYNSFWQGVDRVTATDVTASPPDTAEATITYYFKDGRVSTERTVYTLVKDGDTVKLDNSSVVG